MTVGVLASLRTPQLFSRGPKVHSRILTLVTLRGFKPMFPYYRDVTLKKLVTKT